LLASSVARILNENAVGTPGSRRVPRATVVTPNVPEAEVIAGRAGTHAELAERIHELGATAVIVTGGHSDEPADWLYDGHEHIRIPVERHDISATHGAGCTHSATLTALLARGLSLEDAALGAAGVASDAVAHGLTELGAGEGPVDVFHLKGVT